MFNRSAIKIRSLADRVHDLNLSNIRRLEPVQIDNVHGNWQLISGRILAAKKAGAAVVMMMGGHVIRSGIQRYLIDLMENGYITHLATNGSGMIHDFELSLIGATTESVARYINEGQFGLWRETGMINDFINASYANDRLAGMGETIGQAIYKGDFPYKDISIFAAAYRLKIPITVHVGIGYDIIHEHANCDGAATGALSYNDFLVFAETVQKLENGVVMDFGSAVMAPEVFLKALSMARNVARQKNESVKHFLAVVFDLLDLPADYSNEPAKEEHNYYFRPWKTMLVRTTASGGENLYVKGKHSETIPALWQALNR